MNKNNLEQNNKLNEESSQNKNISIEQKSSNEQTALEEGNFVNNYDIVKYVVTNLTIILIGLIIGMVIAVKIYPIKMAIWKKIFLIKLPILIAFIIGFVQYAPKPLLSYMHSYTNEWAKPVGFAHKSDNGVWPFVGSAIITLNDKDWLFIGGGKNQNDVLIEYSTYHNKFINQIENMPHVFKKNKVATFCATAFDFKNKGNDCLVVGREDGVTLYEHIFSKSTINFVPHKIVNAFDDKVPLAITISDYNKDGLADIYISYFIKSALYKGTVFNDPSHNKSNILLQNKSTKDKFIFEDVTQITKSGGISNTFTAAFVDLDNSGYPSIILSHDSSEIEILKNIEGKYFESILPFSYKGNWMGLGIGDINNNGFQDLFLTNIGGDTPSDKLSLGDVEESQKQTFSHVMLQNNGNYEFTDVTSSMKISPNGFGWGAIIADLNLDGNMDLLFGENFMLNPLHWLYPGSGYYYENKGNGNFDRQFKYKNGNFAQTPLIGDLNNNGLMDVVWINMYGETNVYFGKNENKNNYINVKMPKTSEFANSKVILDLGTKKLHCQIIHGGTGFGCGSTPTITFGLEKNTKAKNIIVKTNYGKKYIMLNPKVNTTLFLKDFTN